MTTSQSPLSRLKSQADTIAQMVKAWQRGEKIADARFAEKMEAARHKPSVKFGIVMDDKVVTIELDQATLAETSEVALAALILKHMRGQRDN